MELPRDRYMNQFGSSIKVAITRNWGVARKDAPTYFSRTLYETLRTTNGKLSVEQPAFDAIIKPVIVDVHSRLARWKRPDPGEFANRVYDALAQAGVELEIGPPLQSHGNPRPR
jgi:hypothetical protein